MTNRSSLLCGAALGVLLAGGIGATAEAKAKHHHAMGASSNASEISTLTAAVGDLEQRLNDETAARQAVEARAAAAEAKADAAEADAHAARGELQAQIQTIPGAVQTAVASNKAKPGWWDSTKIGGTVFVDLSNISQTPKPNKINGTGVDIKRAYLIIDHSFNDVYSANLTLDFAPNGIILGSGTYGTGTLQGSEAVKYAYVQAKYDPRFVIQLGAAKTPWIPFVEDIYGYRFIDKVMIDQNKFGNSSDWGANVHGDFNIEKAVLSYSASVEDGAGYKNPVRSNGLSFEGRVNVNYHGFVAAFGGFTGTESKDFQGITPSTHNASRWDALLAYTDSKIRIGAEYFQAYNYNTVAGTAAVAAVAPTPVFGGACGAGPAVICSFGGSAAVAAVPAKTDNSQGWSVFGSYVFYPQWSVFARYDGLQPSMKLARRERYNYYNIGLNYEPVKTVDLALVYKHEDVSHAAKGGYTDGTTTLAPSSTGSANGTGKLDEIGLYAQFKF